ncbi:microfibril-associated glycoprotein 4-like [Littorina saxatilis]|uniref:microfibril-associated glycoprotein 4-like n=1 Tax=Littorina saxatilis TaxID=31220 RepID=UPI0038B57CB9
MSCAARCATDSTCTAYSYLQETGTCNLHHGDLALHICTKPATTASHMQKLQTNSNAPCQNGGIPINGNTACQCYNGFVGNNCERLMIDCTEGKNSGYYPAMKGLYQAKPSTASGPVQLRCDFQVDQVVLMRWRGDVDFNVTKASYVIGFGDANADYWTGLESLHLVTSNSHTYTLGVQVTNVSNNPFYQRYYTGFKVKSKAEGYSMTFTSSFPGSAPASPMGDCFTELKDLPFSTYDDDNDDITSRNCAADFGGGWWYRQGSCAQCNLVGELRFALNRNPGAVDDVFWLPGLNHAFSPHNLNMFLYR